MRAKNKPGPIRRLLQRAILGKTYQEDGRGGAGGWNTLFGTCVIKDSSDVFSTFSPSDLYALQKTSSLIATCVSKIGSATKAGDLALFHEGEDGDERVEGETAAKSKAKAEGAPPADMARIAAVLKVPNPYMSQGDFTEVISKGLALVGDVYVWVWRDAYGQPEQLWPIPKTWVTANYDANGILAGYSIWQGSGNAAKVVPPEDLIRIWTPDAENPMNAVSAAESVSRELQLDDERSTYLMELLKNVPFAGAVFKQKGEWDTDQKNEIKAKVRDNIGRGARGDIAFVSGENAGVDFPNPLSDLDWPGLSAHLESRVSAAMDVPAIVAGFRVGLEHGTFANFKEANRMFYQGRIAPLGLKITEALTRGLIYADDPNSEYWIAFDWTEVPAMQEDTDAKEKRVLDRLRGMAITRNEARVELGEDAVEGGDVFLDSAGIVPTPTDADPWSGDTGRKKKPTDWSEEEVAPTPDDEQEAAP